MKDLTLETQSEPETAAFARKLAKTLATGDIICLIGTLGAGKSFIAREMIRQLCGAPDIEVPSPTFTLLQTYETPNGPIAHFDLYRLKDMEEVYELGWEDAVSGSIVLVEWPEIIRGILPDDRLEVRIDMVSDKLEHRKITLTGGGPWLERLAQIEF